MIQDMSVDTIGKKRFTVDEYHRMGELGILPETGRFELIRGEIIEMPTPGSPHASRVMRLARVFTSGLGEAVIVSVQNPLSRISHCSRTDPKGGQYRSIRILGRGEAVRAQNLPAIDFTVDELLG